MADLHFVEGPHRGGFKQALATEAEGVQWEIRCQGVDANGHGTICSIFKKTDLETVFRALLVERVHLEDAKQGVRDFHAEETQYGPMRRSILEKLQQGEMPGLTIASVERTHQKIKHGK